MQVEVEAIQNLNNDVVRPELQPGVEAVQTSSNIAEQPEVQAEVEAMQNFSNDVVHPEPQVNDFENLEYGFGHPDLEPFKSPPSNARLR